MMYDLNEIQEKLKKKISQKRYNHILSTAYLSASLAMSYGEDCKLVFLAGLLHDCAKHMKDADLLLKCREYNIPITNYEEKNPFLLHAKMGAHLAEHKYGVREKAVLDAILYHINGRPDMTFIEKAVYTADFLEFWRKHLGDEAMKELRKLAFFDINKAIYEITNHIIQYLTESDTELNTDIYHVRDFYSSPLKWRT